MLGEVIQFQMFESTVIYQKCDTNSTMMIEAIHILMTFNFLLAQSSYD